MTDELTIENFKEKTGSRFRVSQEQKARIADGTLTREGALQEFLAAGGREKIQARNRPDVPDSIYQQDGLTIENFGERVKAEIGVNRRFRVSREQAKRIEEGSLTREQALEEVIAAKRQGVKV